jgi:hypothetical protein
VCGLLPCVIFLPPPGNERCEPLPFVHLWDRIDRATSGCARPAWSQLCSKLGLARVGRKQPA